MLPTIFQEAGFQSNPSNNASGISSWSSLHSLGILKRSCFPASSVLRVIWAHEMFCMARFAGVCVWRPRKAFLGALTTVQPYNDSVNSTAVRVLLTALTTVLSTVNCWQLTMNSTVDCCLTTVQLQPYDAHNCTLLLTRPHEINLKRTQSSRCNAHFTWGHLFIF